jgi:hypothetical protein
MLGPALTWLGVARDCFRDPHGGLTRGLLTSVFALVVGLERVFHLDQMEDTGFALLTGGRSCPDRFAVGGWRRHLPWYEVDAFCRRTSPWELIRGEAALLSYDEHAIPRWTHKFHIPKGYVTTRNKYMRCEKLFYTYDLLHGRYLAVRATPGDWGLDDLALPLLRQALGRGRPQYVHALFDAGAGPSDAAVRTLWDWVEQEHPQLDVTLRAYRHPHRVRLWKALPAEQFAVRHEPGPYVGAPPKEVRLAETTTVLKGEAAEQAVRTVVCREVVRGPKNDRWHPLFTTGLQDPEEVLGLFRLRQRHEQGYGTPPSPLPATSPRPPPRCTPGPPASRSSADGAVYRSSAEQPARGFAFVRHSRTAIRQTERQADHCSRPGQTLPRIGAYFAVVLGETGVAQARPQGSRPITFLPPQGRPLSGGGRNRPNRPVATVPWDYRGRFDGGTVVPRTEAGVRKGRGIKTSRSILSPEGAERGSVRILAGGCCCAYHDLTGKSFPSNCDRQAHRDLRAGRPGDRKTAQTQ